MHRTVLAALAISGAAYPANAALAEAPAPALEAAPNGNTETYDRAFFQQFSPQTALDMVRRVPGFSIDGGSDRRGFSGAAGNVLIDGARPSAKSESIESILSRIPQAQVARIELIRAASTGEAAGQSVVVNVIRASNAKALSGAYSVEVTRNDDNRFVPFGSGSLTLRRGKTELTLGADRYLEAINLRGIRRLTDADGDLIGTRTDLTPRTYREANANAALSTPLLGGTLRLNASGGRNNFRTNLESLGRTPAGVISDSFRLSINERRRQREIGGDYERAFGPLTLKAVGLDTRRWHAEDDGTLVRDAVNRTTGLVAQTQRDTSSETIGRLSANWTINPRHQVEFGGETALNTLDASLDLVIDGAPVALQAANVRVEEDRQEGFVTWTWKPDARWTLESGVTVETSTISQSGDTSASRTLTYWKPSVQLSRQLGARDQARVRLFRDVSQLDFGDFVSSASLADDRVAAGNPDLRPQSLWRLEGAFDKRFGAKGAVTVTVAHEWIEDASDSVPILDLTSVPPGCAPPSCPSAPRFFDAPGNIGKGATTQAELRTTLPLNSFLKGAQLEGTVAFADSEVTDPTTRAKRQISSFADVFYSIDFRQDLPEQKLAWGWGMEKASERRFFRVSERETYEEGPFLAAFVESTRFGPVKVRLGARNLLNTTFRRERRFFSPNRAGDFTNQELRKRHQGQVYSIEVTGNF